MPKRTSTVHDGDEPGPLKGGSRPGQDQDMMDIDETLAKDMGEFEDEFEDEFDDEEILEAGVDGRPDAEREAEEKGASSLMQSYCMYSAKLTDS